MRGHIALIFLITTVVHLGNASLSFKCPVSGPVFDEDINFFHLCVEGQMSKRVKCPENSGFLKNDKKTGCVPYQYWQCTNKKGKSPPDCSKPENVGKLHAHVNPNLYWACSVGAKGAKAAVMKCPEETAFSIEGEIFGCVPRNQWRCVDRKKFDDF